MKRLKTISLFLYACIGLFLQFSYAQSSSCSNLTNLTVDANCEFTISPETLSATGPAATAGSMILEKGGRTLFEFTGGVTTGSIIDLGIPNGGVMQYELYASDDGTGPMLCWGQINFEVKGIPEPVFNRIEIMCSQPLPDLITIEDFQEGLDDLCSATIEDLFVTNDKSGDACSGFLTVRTIRGTVDYNGTKVSAILRVDTIVETPLDTSMVVCPIGGPTKLEAIILHCDDIGNTYPTPEVVEEYAAEGIRAAYPYVDKGLDTTIVLVDSVVRINDTITKQILVVDDNGNEFWVFTDVVDKRDTIIAFPDTTISEIVVPLNNTSICNLSVKYSDQQFPGCAGPDSKIMRTWNVLDWCNGSIKECVQWIVVETEGPIIDSIPDVFVPIAPWTCTSEYRLSAVVDQGCSETLDVIYQTSVGIIEDGVLTGLWLGQAAEVTVIAIDDCGQRAEETFLVTPIDSLPPVAIANDQINISLSGDPLVVDTLEDRGVAKVYVDAVDAGSHNAGCGEVERCLLLHEELQNPVIIGGIHVEVDGKPIYHAHGCQYDGVLPAIPPTKLSPGRAEIFYVYCKDHVKFCCESIGDNSVAMVVSNGGGMNSVTWTTITVEDKSSPIVICPDPIKVGCDEDYVVPRPTIFQGVCSIDELEVTVVEDLDNCGDGVKTYTWTRNGEVVCVSEVFIDGASGFNPYEIKWPIHYNGAIESGIRRECELVVDEDGDPILDDNGQEQYVIVERSDDIPMGEPFECTGEGFTGEPVWCNASCGLVGVNFEDLNLEGISACKKIVRKWTIIDWCSWDPNNSNIDDENDTFDQFTAVNDEWLGEGNWLTDSRNTEGEPCEECDKPAGDSEFLYFRYDTVDVDGYYTFDQVIKILDFAEPVVSAPDTVTLSIFGGATSKGDDFDDCVTSDILDATAEDFCGNTSIDASTLDWFIQVFRLDDGEEVLLNTKETVGATADMSTQIGQSGNVHKIRWTVRDGCGNIGSTETYVIFVEDKNPTPICLQTLSTSTMSTDGSVTIWATDFDAGSFDNCSTVDLFFKDANDNFVPSLTFTCGDLDDGVSQVFNLDLFAVDALGNHDFCTVALQVNDFGDNCEDTGSRNANEVRGQVATAFGDMVEDVMVSMNVGMEEMTSVEGKYAFKDVTYTAFEISATRDDDYLNGVTALDALLIQRHMLSLDEFDNPYQLIAGDINNDGRVSALDLVDLRKLILGVTNEFPRNKSWRFVPSDFEFNDPTQPFPFTEVITINDFDGFAGSKNFVGIKIGDVNGNAVANSLINADTRSTRLLTLSVLDEFVKEGEMVNVQFSSDEFDHIDAYQFTIELSGLELFEVKPGALNLSDANFAQISDEVITTTWHSTEGRQEGSNLFEMNLRALRDLNLRESIQITSAVTNAVAYDMNGDQLDINIAFANKAPETFALYQNVPNPFKEQTVIGFDVPSDGSTTLSIFDVTGKLVLKNIYDFEQGYQEVIMRKSDLDQTGVLYYQIENGDFTATRKMILID